MLVKALSLHLKPGDHLMVTGSNGVGKTSVARVLAGLWAASPSSSAATGSASDGIPQSKVYVPSSRQDIFFVPQRAYHPPSSLLEQIIYPDSYVDVIDGRKRANLSQTTHQIEETLYAELQEILLAVHLEYLPEREGGWTTRKEWRDVLSGGEKQRMGLARVFWRKPRWAVLDGMSFRS
jgi:ATP-binding cassette, subfamily D (ALD), peroxisomal long-chain fatty acid import protein